MYALAPMSGLGVAQEGSFIKPDDWIVNTSGASVPVTSPSAPQTTNVIPPGASPVAVPAAKVPPGQEKKRMGLAVKVVLGGALVLLLGKLLKG